MGKKKKHKDPLFRKDEEGKDLFYPWGCPGEAFYVNQRTFNRILIFLNIFSILFVVYVCGAVFADLQNMISQNTWNQLFSSVFIFFPGLYICGMHLFSKGASVYVVPKEIFREGLNCNGC